MPPSSYPSRSAQDTPPPNSSIDLLSFLVTSSPPSSSDDVCRSRKQLRKVSMDHRPQDVNSQDIYNHQSTESDFNCSWEPSRLVPTSTYIAPRAAYDETSSEHRRGHGIHDSFNCNTSPKDSGNESEKVSAPNSRRRESSDDDDTHDSNFEGYTSSGGKVSPTASDAGQQLESDLESIAYTNGRKGDPRMNVAVALKNRHPSMSLIDCLTAGGFKFPENFEKSSLTEKNIFDEDNVSLQQRKNQLNRRIRYAKKYAKTKTRKNKGEKKTTESSSGATATKGHMRGRSSNVAKRGSKEDEGGATMSDAVTSMSSFPPPVIGTPVSKCDVDLKSSTLEEHHKLNDNKRQRRSMERRDSFLEKILELPGLDDLPNP